MNIGVVGAGQRRGAEFRSGMMSPVPVPSQSESREVDSGRILGDLPLGLRGVSPTPRSALHRTSPERALQTHRTKQMNQHIHTERGHEGRPRRMLRATGAWATPCRLCAPLRGLKCAALQHRQRSEGRGPVRAWRLASGRQRGPRTARYVIGCWRPGERGGCQSAEAAMHNVSVGAERQASRSPIGVNPVQCPKPSARNTS